MGDSFYSDYDYYDYDDPHDETLFARARKSGVSYGKAGHEFAKQISWFSKAIGCVLFLIIIALAGFLVNALL